MAIEPASRRGCAFCISDWSVPNMRDLIAGHSHCGSATAGWLVSLWGGEADD
jgi:hypothetical protein